MTKGVIMFWLLQGGNLCQSLKLPSALCVMMLPEPSSSLSEDGSLLSTLPSFLLLGPFCCVLKKKKKKKKNFRKVELCQNLCRAWLELASLWLLRVLCVIWVAGFIVMWRGTDWFLYNKQTKKKHTLFCFLTMSSSLQMILSFIISVLAHTPGLQLQSELNWTQHTCW